jgi:hypothetical protein
VRTVQILDLYGTFGRQGIKENRIVLGLKKYKATGILLTLHPTRVAPTMADIDYIANTLHMRPGIVLDRGDWGNRDGAALSNLACDWLVGQGFVGMDVAKACDVCIVNERHGDADMCDDILKMINAFRARRGLRTFMWGLEGGQGGWFNRTLVDRINADPDMTVLPEAYFGPSASTRDMDPRDIHFIKKNINDTGVIPDRVKAFYGAIYKDVSNNNVPLPPFDGWDGVLWALDQVA